MASSEAPYRLETGAGYVLVELLPALSDSHWVDIEKAGADLLEHSSSTHAPGLIIDLSALNYMGSAMVALIVRLWKAAKARDARMVVVNKDETVFSVLKLAGLTKVWTVVQTREQGLQLLNTELKKEATAAAVQKRSPILAGVLETLATIGAVVGLVLLLLNSDLLPRNALLGIALGCAGVALLAGLVSAIRRNGLRRGIDVAVVLANTGIIVMGLYAAEIIKLKS